MKNQSKQIKEDKQINNLLETQHQIYQLYRKLETEKQENERKKIKTYIQMAKNLEEKILFSLFGKKEERIRNRITYLLTRKSFNQSEKEDILERIETQEIMYYYQNPFLAIAENQEIEKKENQECIQFQILCEFNQRYLNYLENIIQSEQNPKKINFFKTITYEFLFINPFLENKQFINYKERCLLFNQDQDLINKNYEELAIQTINNSLKYILKYNDTKLQNEKFQCFLQLELINLQCALDIVEKDEQIKLCEKIAYFLLTNKKKMQSQQSIQQTLKILNTYKKEETIPLTKQIINPIPTQ